MSVKINITNINLITNWDFIGDPRTQQDKHDCKLCRRPLIMPPLQEMEVTDTKGVYITGKLSKGECGDIFHEKCINSMLNSGSTLCPNCNTQWNQSKILKSGIINPTHEQSNTDDVVIKKKTILKKQVK